MKKPKVIYQNKADNNISEQKSSSCSHFHLVLHRLFFKKKDILGLYSYKLRVFLKALLSRRCSNSGNNYIRNSRNLRVAGITSSFLFVLLSAAIIIPIHNRTNNVEATTGTSKQSDTELSITTSSNVAGVDLLVKDNNGTFASSDDGGNTLGFNVTTNNYTGYTLTISGKDDTGKLTNTDIANCTDAAKCALNTISSASSTISANGTWGYKPSKLNSATNSNYLPSPTTTATTLDKTTTANTTDTYNTYTIGLAARADYIQPAGVYSNTYVLQATGNPVNYAITYNKNTTDTVTNMPTYSGSNTQSGSTSETEIDVSTTVPVRTNYTFLGWCDTTTTTNNTDSCSGTIYNVNGAGTSDSNLKYGIDQTTTNVTTFYAMWKLNNYTITYNANNGTGSVSSQSITPGNTVALADNGFTRSNYYFMGWSTSSSATSPEYRTNQAITPTGSITLYAVWGSSAGTKLYDAVASLTRGMQTNDTNALTGIKTNPTKATSGVWTYNTSVFGVASDASTSNPIYYYRGILDKTTGSYGSDGDSMDYPNYVKLASDDGTTYTCWRIVRTTGSGGVKMVYNGKWTGSTCANSQSNAQLTTSAFNVTSNVGNKSIIAVGYTFNSGYKTTTASTAAGTLFGTDSNYTGNNTRSTIKAYIEDAWYASNMTSWTSKLETSAGYCNDRSVYNSSGDKLSDTDAIVTPYTTATSGVTVYYFGAYERNSTSAQAPSLTCPYATRDLYRYVASSAGVSNQLKYPAALLTADELSFAGSGFYTTSGSGYHANSYLRSGSSFWLLSPAFRYSDGYADGYLIDNSGSTFYTTSLGNNGVRPAISLKSGTTIASGSGTATDPWVIDPPTAMQDLNLSTCSKNVGLNGNPSGVGDEITVYDRRDGSDYTVRYINGACWMTQNLRITGTISSTDSNYSGSSYNISANDLATNGTSGGKCYSSNGYVNPCTKDSGDTTKGVWYNYCAATVGTICTSSTSTAATQDICPSGWHLPTGAANNTSSEFYKLFQSTSSNWIATNTYLTAFGAVAGGYYSNGSLVSEAYGHWWSATASDATSRYYLYYDSSISQFLSTNSRRGLGFFVRCVRTS